MNLLSRRRALMFNQKSMLPSNYRLTEYIESTGAEYIDIDFYATQDTSAKGTFQIMDTQVAASLFGSRVSASSNGYVLNWGGGIPYKFYNTIYSNAVTTRQIDGEKHSFEKKGLDFYLDGELIHTHTEVPNFTTPVKMMLFGCNSNGSRSYSKVRLYELKFYDKDILKVDLVPCFDIVENVAGLYDLVNHKFYKSDWKAFKVGRYADKLQNYQIIDYIESSGTQYINTDIIPSNSTIIETEFQLTKIGANYPFGVRTTSQDKICYLSGGTEVWNPRYGLVSECTYGTTDMDVHNIKMGIDGIYWDGELIDSPDTSPFTCMGNLYLFALNNNGLVSYGKTKIYSFKMYTNGVLIRNFVPCYRKGDGVVGMFDTVNNYFYENIGTGEFITGGET